MLRNYFLTALRHFRKYKFYTILNLLGLSIGISCSLLIFFYIQYERSYDQHFEHSDRIYRLGAEYTISGKVDQYANLPRPIGPNLKIDFPEITAYTRMVGMNGLSVHRSMVEYQNERFFAEKAFRVDSTYFEVFSHSFLAGNPQDALRRPNSIVLTQSLAKRIFGGADPYQKTIRLDNRTDMLVTAVLKDPPTQTHIPFDCLVSWSTYPEARDLTQWIGGHIFTYVLFPEGYQPQQLLDKFPAFYEKHMKSTFESLNGSFQLLLQPLTDIHLHSHLTWEAYPNGNMANLYIFGTVALFLLIIACINYMNLATAQSVRRAQEIGMRKVMGAIKSKLVYQFLTEAVILAIAASVVAILGSYILLPLFNGLSGLQLSSNIFSTVGNLLGVIGLGIMIGLIAGLYPAFYLSRFQPSEVLKSKSDPTGKGKLFRKMLVVGQFTIATCLIVATIVVWRQMNYVKSKDLGFDNSHVMVITVQDTLVEKQLPALRNEFLSHPDIISVATSRNLPGLELNHTLFNIEQADGTFEQSAGQFMEIDQDYVEMMAMQIVAGRDFDRSFGTDSDQSVLINQMAATKYGWGTPQEALGRKINLGEDDEGNPVNMEVVGVLNDFHVNSMHHEVTPVVLFLMDSPAGKLYLRLSAENIAQTIGVIEEKWKSIDPNFPMEYLFLDNSFEQLYQSERKLSQLFWYFSLLTIAISCLGLLGLISFTVNQKTREIGIRKVMGASVQGLVNLLSRETLLLVGIANLIAWPLAAYGMTQWLGSFAYRISLSWWEFGLAALLTVLIAFFTISVQVVRAARLNPAETLKYE